MTAAVEISHAKMPEKLEIAEEIQNFLEKFEERWKITKFKVDVDFHSPGGKLKYSMHAKVTASGIIFNAEATGWDIPSTLNSLFEKLGKRIGKELKKRKTKRFVKTEKFGI